MYPSALRQYTGANVGVTRFFLRKWYLDIVTDGGDAAIIYAAQLTIGAVRVGYQSLLRHSPGLPTTTRTRFRAPTEPHQHDDTLHWHSRALDTRGTWAATAPPVERTVLDDAHGCIRWNCLAPGARATLVDGATTLTGHGYAEVLTLTAPPWSLPIRELWWGRFVSADACLTWIDWRGPHTFRTVLLDGVEVADATVNEGGIASPTVNLRFDLTELLRQGQLGFSALSLLPRRVLQILPGRTLLIDETKWLSRSRLQRAGKAESHGWTIHEVVRWP
ncbi:MAG: hypothetical protein HY904_09985 [Deltaproteobacteria bacterium]|nr:hypothetical protein [Deltaproteobacteria bacterium]